MKQHNHQDKTNYSKITLRRSENSDGTVPEVNFGINKSNDKSILATDGNPNNNIGVAFFYEDSIELFSFILVFGKFSHTNNELLSGSLKNKNKSTYPSSEVFLIGVS